VKCVLGCYNSLPATAFVIKKKTAPLLIKSSAVRTSSSTTNNNKRRPRQVRGKEWRVTVRTLSNADLIMISGISSHPRRAATSAVALPVLKAGSKLVLAAGINSSTTVTMTPMAPLPPPPPRTTTTQSAVVDTASVYYPADAAYKTVDRVEVQLMRNPFAKRHSLVRGGGPPSNALLERLKIGMYFGVWYALNVIYNSKCLLKQ
jgi:hypothetical protein